jgi:hypothetical protein
VFFPNPEIARAMNDNEQRDLKLRVFVNDVYFAKALVEDERSFIHKHFPLEGKIEISIRPKLMDIPEG